MEDERKATPVFRLRVWAGIPLGFYRDLLERNLYGGSTCDSSVTFEKVLGGFHLGFF